jgi:hypothetical protein
MHIDGPHWRFVRVTWGKYFFSVIASTIIDKTGVAGATVADDPTHHQQL